MVVILLKKFLLLLIFLVDLFKNRHFSLPILTSTTVAFEATLKIILFIYFLNNFNINIRLIYQFLVFRV